MSGYSQNSYHNAMSPGGFLKEGQADGSTPGGSTRLGPNTSLRAVTTHQILRHVQQQHSDAEFSLDGIDLGPISLVALLLGVKVQATNTVFTLHDGWGQVEGRTWKDGNVDIEEEEEMNKEDGLEEGRYVYVVGQLKSLHGRKHLNITAVRPVKNYNEVLHHQLEVISNFLFNTRKIDQGNQIDATMQDASVYQAGGSANVSGANDPAASLPPFVRTVYEAIKSNRGRTEGVHVATIARTIQNQHGKKTTPGEVSDAIDTLMDEGLVYSTIDESHYDIAT